MNWGHCASEEHIKQALLWFLLDRKTFNVAKNMRGLDYMHAKVTHSRHFARGREEGVRLWRFPSVIYEYCRG